MNSQIILASASPRRKELLAQIGYDFTVVVSDVDENIEKCEPSEYVKELSKRKAMAVASMVGADSNEGCSTVIIGADTVVAIGGEILGKPKDEEDAVKMLLMLSGQCHSVYTGVTLVSMTKASGIQKISGEAKVSCESKMPGEQKIAGEAKVSNEKTDVSIESFCDETRVYMYPITEQEARDYVVTGEPMDKAGSYAIQGIAGKFVEKIEGSYNNVVGLPVEKIYQRLK